MQRRKTAFVAVLVFIISIVLPLGVLAEESGKPDEKLTFEHCVVGKGENAVYWDAKNTWGPSYYLQGSTIDHSADALTEFKQGSPGSVNEAIVTSLEMGSEDIWEVSKIDWKWDKYDPKNPSLFYRKNGEEVKNWWQKAKPFDQYSASIQTDNAQGNILWSRFALSRDIMHQWQTNQVYTAVCNIPYTGTVPEDTWKGKTEMLKPASFVVLSNNPTISLGETRVAGYERPVNKTSLNGADSIEGWYAPNDHATGQTNLAAEWRPLQYDGTLI